MQGSSDDVHCQPRCPACGKQEAHQLIGQGEKRTTQLENQSLNDDLASNGSKSFDYAGRTNFMTLME